MSIANRVSFPAGMLFLLPEGKGRNGPPAVFAAAGFSRRAANEVWGRPVAQAENWQRRQTAKALQSVSEETAVSLTKFRVTGRVVWKYYQTEQDSRFSRRKIYYQSRE